MNVTYRRAARPATWSFLTNHTHVLVLLATDPHIRLRDVAVRIGITERATQRILADLVAAGYVDRTRVGRRNRYTLVLDKPLPLPASSEHTIGEHTIGEHTIGELIDVLCRSRASNDI